jgi:catechol 2,3-dioxygenase-like lactoylglutathione lyase family enzyme
MTMDADRIELFLTELRVVDWPGAVRWYVEVLGMRAVLEDAEHRFALLEAGGGGRLALKGGGPAVEAREAVRLTFRVDDVDAERARLVALGVAVGEPSDNHRERYREVRLADPEGTPITLFGWTAGPSAGQ